MADSAKQALKFEEFYKRLSEDWSRRSEDAVQSYLRFQKNLAEQYGGILQNQKSALKESCYSDYARAMMALFLSVIPFQREQLAMLVDSQISWNDMYRRFLDSLGEDVVPDTPNAPK